MISFEEAQEIGRKNREEQAKREKIMKEAHEKWLKDQGLVPPQKVEVKYDHPCMPEDGFVTFLYIVGMIGSLVFKQWYIAWFALTVWYGMFTTRHDNK